MLYQSDIFTGTNFWPQLRLNTTAYTRWDIAFSQELPLHGIQVYGNVNNLNGAKDINAISGGSVVQSMQDYGMTADLGFRVNL
jgi:hypothetical protein